MKRKKTAGRVFHKPPTPTAQPVPLRSDEEEENETDEDEGEKEVRSPNAENRPRAPPNRAYGIQRGMTAVTFIKQVSTICEILGMELPNLLQYYRVRM